MSVDDVDNKSGVDEGSNPSASTKNTLYTLFSNSVFLMGAKLGIDTRGIGKPRLIDWQSATKRRCKR